MADYETEEQQVEALKQWWAENGRAVILGIVLGLGGIFGWRAWQGQQQAAAEDASSDYTAMMQTLEQTDQGEAFLAAVKTMKDDHGGTTYAAMASLAEARFHVENEDLDAAAKALRWTIDEGAFAEVKSIARLRLARLLNAQGKPAEALKMLDKVQPEAYAGMADEIRGDIHLAAGELVKAREAYQRASESGSPTLSADKLQMKIDDLAGPETQVVGDGQS